jgi:2,3-dihydroxybiphenyl 1,2-dioxygenase
MSGPGPTQLGYFGIAARRPDDWRDYSGGFLGMQASDLGAGHLGLRMDERAARFLVHPAQHDGMSFFGFETADEQALQDLSNRLSNAGHQVTQASPGELELRQVNRMNWVCDPDGNRVEFFCGPAQGQAAFMPDRPIGGFRAGDLGLGHVVMMTAQYDPMRRFYLETVGLRLSDYVTTPFRGSFMHMNPRHHSVAILEGPKPMFHHVMVEYEHLDDVGRLYDKALLEPGRVSVTLGRHANDHMLSFYSKTPGGFMIETGWAGRLVDDASWVPHEVYGPSIWGHDRTWLPPEVRAQAREILDDAAARGVRAPVQARRAAGFDLALLEPGSGRD